MAASKKGGGRLFFTLGLAAAGGAGYYLYSAGGDPKVAEKQFQRESQYLFSIPSYFRDILDSHRVRR